MRPLYQGSLEGRDRRKRRGAVAGSRRQQQRGPERWTAGSKHRDRVGEPPRRVAAGARREVSSAARRMGHSAKSCLRTAPGYESSSIKSVRGILSCACAMEAAVRGERRGRAERVEGRVLAAAARARRKCCAGAAARAPWVRQPRAAAQGRAGGHENPALALPPQPRASALVPGVVRAGPVGGGRMSESGMCGDVGGERARRARRARGRMSGLHANFARVRFRGACDAWRGLCRKVLGRWMVGGCWSKGRTT